MLGRGHSAGVCRDPWLVLGVALVTLASCSGSPSPVDARRDLRRDVAADGRGGDISRDVVGIDLPLARDHGSPDRPRPDAPPSCPPGAWCSKLYPPGWTPSVPADSAGRFLHDFSYAGYHGGAQAIPQTPPGQTYDVLGFGADNTGASDATGAIQKAIAAASGAGGGIVFLPAGTYLCSGTLQISSNRVVLRGAGKSSTTIRFTAFAGMSYKSHISFTGNVTRGTDLPLAQDGAVRSSEVRLASLGSLKVGDEVALGWEISPDFVAEHQMTGTWTAFAGQWKPFFRRTVVAIDAASAPARVTLDVPLRYDAKVRDKASLRVESGYLEECGIEHLSLSNAVKWEDAWSQNQVHALSLAGVKDCWVRDVHSAKSPTATGWSPLDTAEYHLQSSGIVVVGSKRVTVTGSTLRNAQHRGSGGNGYLFEVSASNEVLFADCEGESGRHNLIQNWDFGATGCVFLRCKSTGGRYATIVLGVPLLTPAMSEYHHSLAMANLVDQCQIDDGWQAVNRYNESSGAGHTATGCVFWNTSGGGTLLSLQYGWGYVIGTGAGVTTTTALTTFGATGTQPEDYTEGLAQGASLWPPSLYEDQLARRLSP